MFNDDRRKNASFIFEKMKKVYPTFENPDEFSIGEWTGVLDGYSQTEILDAFKEYRKNVPYNSAPTPSAFKPFLHHKSEPEAQAPQTVAQAAKGDFAWERMASDINVGCCRNNLYVYRDAERIVLNEWLLEYLPFEVVNKMSYGSKVKQAMEKGLFNNFEEALKQAAQARFGRDFEFLSDNDLGNQQRENMQRYWTKSGMTGSEDIPAQKAAMTGNEDTAKMPEQVRHDSVDCGRHDSGSVVRYDNNTTFRTVEDIGKTLAAHWKMGA